MLLDLGRINKEAVGGWRVVEASKKTVVRRVVIRQRHQNALSTGKASKKTVARRVVRPLGCGEIAASLAAKAAKATVVEVANTLDIRTVWEAFHIVEKNAVGRSAIAQGVAIIDAPECVHGLGCEVWKLGGRILRGELEVLDAAGVASVGVAETDAKM